MAYTAWSVVFGEQPTAAKWNQLGANDAGFKDMTNVDDNSLALRHIPNALITAVKLATHLKIGSISGASVLNSTGNKSISGVGFKPQAVIFIGRVANGTSLNFSFGAMDGSGNQFASTGSHSHGTTNSYRDSATNRCQIVDASGTSTIVQALSYVSMDTDGFTINVNTAGSIDTSYIAIG